MSVHCSRHHAWQSKNQVDSPPVDAPYVSTLIFYIDDEFTTTSPSSPPLTSVSYLSVPLLWIRWRIQKPIGCQPSSAGTHTSVGNMQMRLLLPNSTRTSFLCLEELRPTVCSTWRYHPPSTMMLPGTSSSAVWPQSQCTHFLLCHTCLSVVLFCLNVCKQEELNQAVSSMSSSSIDLSAIFLDVQCSAHFMYNSDLHWGIL